MMKTKNCLIGIIISIILFTGMKGFSQNWAPIGATWYYNYEGAVYGPPFHIIISYIKFESEKDSLINGWNCRKIVQSSPDNDNKINYFMYSDSNKVYEVENNQKYLLYDFNKKKGEYWLLPKYDYDTIFVDSTDIVTLLNGQQRNVQYVHINSTNWYCSKSIIENIGFQISLFPVKMLLGGGNIGERRCYFENNLALITSNTPCDYQNIGEYTLEENVSIQNPVSQQIRFNILDYRILPLTSIVIYNSNGVIIYQKKENFNWIIDFSDKASGVYFIKFIFKDNQTLIKKIIKI